MRASLNVTARGEASGPVARVILLLKIPFPSGALLVNTGDKPYTYSGDTYLPGPQFAGLSQYGETLDMAARKSTLALSGCDDALKAALMGDAIHGLQITAHLAFLDANHNVLATMDSMYVARVDTAKLNLDAGAGTVELTGMGLLQDLRDGASVRLTSADQQQRYPGDTGLDQIPLLQNRQIEWGGQKSTIGQGGAGGPGGDRHQGQIGGIDLNTWGA